MYKQKMSFVEMKQKEKEMEKMKINEKPEVADLYVFLRDIVGSVLNINIHFLYKEIQRTLVKYNLEYCTVYTESLSI